MGDVTAAAVAQYAVLAAAYALGGGIDDMQPGYDFLRQLAEQGRLDVSDASLARIESGEIDVCINWDYNSLNYRDQILENNPNAQFSVNIPSDASVQSGYCTIINKNEGTQVNRLITTVAGVYLFFAVLGFNRNIVGAEIFIPYLVSIIYLLISELYFDRAKSIYNWAFSLMAQLYIALPFSLLNVLSYVVSRDPYTLEYNVVYTPTLVLSVFIYLWASDTGAYCFGSMLGKHKLFPRISPNKT